MYHFIKIGKIIAPYGILGWIKIFSFTEKPEKIFNYIPWLITNQKKSKIIKPLFWKKQKKILLIKIKNINDREIAQKLNNYSILVHEEQLPKLPEHEYYWKDIINCHIINFNNNIGIVTNIINTGSNDILIIKNNNLNQKIILIPFIMHQVIKNINLIHKVITVEWTIKS
ncbi:Ribosome maturation factor RimM [Buchnera aphidicola (Eriosoma grossulariae)]|uniref:ribosome maturation factor RimM n=1 Tax=Buchnera aphidicola TaxID=9 RepID=UPI003464B6FD